MGIKFLLVKPYKTVVMDYASEKPYKPSDDGAAGDDFVFQV